ncbi:NADH-quinone oxidoreductase subunit N [Flammeovirga aprica]|uniref:NADH-quinone oxidoreductase subunit N n=1 Tax=Flammeovirga aprica JL-4 TaxID=694437 RepID=A0A7X9RXL7_9BACT|nr:NADH-quinone oxidoreductase subunit N [Flammeovirga aprica]NME70534.1 NADH-quinone oxidoreductase subunit N [Flammeovirga aprica JL-4]
MEQDLSSKLSNIVESLPFLVSELGIAVLLIAIILIDLIFKQINKKHLYILVGLGLLVDILYLTFLAEATVSKLMLFTLIQDSWSIKLRILCDVCTILLLIHLYFNSSERTSKTKLSGEGEWMTMALGILLGAHVLTMANDFIVAILALELMSLPSYLLTAFKGDKKGVEASIKYFLFGAVATAITIYGMSLLYGLTSTIDLQGIASYSKSFSPLYITGAILVMMGFVFKLGGFPMHIWVPDVYQSAPIEAVAFFSTLPKVGATVFLYRFLVEAQLIDNPYISNFLLATGVLSMFIGNLAAIFQKGLRRLMGYSTIASAGLIIIALLNKEEIAANALFYFLWVYVIANYVMFYFIGEVEKEKGTDNLQELEGLGWSNNAVLWGPATILAVVSLIGLPPLAGFTAKLLIFTSLWELYNTNSDIVYVVVLFLGLLNTAISLVYYLKIPFFLYRRNTKGQININIALSRFIVILGVFLVLTFLVPSLII